ncbi:MAG: hypothetical protein C3F07_12655 [Anaerolineales bacterium]|nr:hypothetical protein [Anaerolineae bacterium]PWB72067.1 MAG: hypothetical protein C3F07_12655 [Anaerolineales bacterium]
MAAKEKAKPKSKVQTKEKNPAAKQKGSMQAKSRSKAAGTKKKKSESGQKVRVVNKISAPRVVKNGDDHKSSKTLRMIPQYNYMRAPDFMHDFQVGDKVEVYCDHEKNKERVRGWIAGIVVQVDNKMVAVQFRSNVFLTDGWMVPDRILWYPLSSEHIRPVAGKRSARKEKPIPDY